MAALPKKKLSRSRSRKRSSTKVYRESKLIACENCKQLKLAHRVCSNCGYYKGKEVLKKEEEIKIKKVEDNEG